MKNRIKLLSEQVEALKYTLVQLINKSLENQESLESLVEKSERLREQAKVFKKRSQTLNETMWLQAHKKTMKMVAFFLGVAIVGVFSLLGGLGIMAQSTAFLLVLATVALTTAFIAGVELFSQLQAAGKLKNPFQFFNNRKTERDGDQSPSSSLERN
jgi:hypothetical protein